MFLPFLETCLLIRGKYLATVQAQTKCQIFSLSVDSFYKVLKDYPEVLKDMKKSTKEAIRFIWCPQRYLKCRLGFPASLHGPVHEAECVITEISKWHLASFLWVVRSKDYLIVIWMGKKTFFNTLESACTNCSSFVCKEERFWSNGQHSFRCAHHSSLLLMSKV